MKQKGLIRKNIYIDFENAVVIAEIRLVGIIVFRHIVALECVKRIGLKLL